MEDSVLNSTKKVLGVDASYTAFDQDIIMHINSVFSTLHQLGVGPADGFEIQGVDEKWSDYIAGNKLLNSVKTYMYLRVRLLFDPPATSFHQESMQNQLKELEWRLNVQSDGGVQP